MSDQTDHSSAAAAAPYRHEITISVGGDSEDRIHINTPPSVSTPTPSPRSIQSTTDEISNSTDDDHAVLTPKQKTSPNGMDNLAFENEHKTSQQRPMSSFGQNENGTKKEPANGKNGIEKPLADAVNLELVNLNKTPTTNGHRDNGFPQKKKDTTQVEMGNSYNEYFVPVNEHKKYMRERGLRGVDHFGHSLNEPIEGIVDYSSWRKIARGEKLYVTKDKRLKTNWRKRLLWVIGLALCAAVLIVAILLATGTIGSEPEPIESRQFSSKDKLATAGIFGGGSKGKQNDTYPSTPQPPGSTVPSHLPTTDENMSYVPNSVNGKLKIENTEFLEEYKDHSSPIYQTIKRELEDELMESLKEYNGVHVKVLNLTPGSIVVDYRVTWDEDEDLSDDILMNSLSKYLKKNHGYLISYFVPTETLSYTKVIDTCAMQTNEMKCENGCEFDHKSADFVCSKLELDSNAEPEPEVSSSSPEPEPKSEPEPNPESEPTPESEPPTPEKEPTAEVEPEPATAEPSAKQVDVEASSEPNHITPDSEPKPEGEPSAEVEPEPAIAEPSAKHSNIEIESEDIEHVTSEPISKVEPSPEGEPNAEVEPEAATPEPSIKHIDVEATSEPISKVEPTPDSEPKAEVEPEPATAEPSAKHSNIEIESEDIEHVTSEPISKVEPEPEIVAEDSTAEPVPEIEKKNTKNGKELSYEDVLSSEEKNENFESKEAPIEDKHELPVEAAKDNEKIESTTRKQKYTYDFDPQQYSDEKEEKIEISSERHDHPIVLPNESPAEGSTLRSSAPVTEDLSDDTPLPTENYFKTIPKITEEERTEVNVMDGTVTLSSINLTSPTIYSTTAPIKLEYEESSSPSVRLIPHSTSENPTYSVTENILEQSPFLPEHENDDSVLNNLHTSHDDNNDETKTKNLDVDDDTSSAENENANFISGPEIVPQKTYKVAQTSYVPQNTTVLKEVEASDEKTEVPSDSTEIYNVEESRTHNHDNVHATKVVENQSDETMEFSHNTEGVAVPTTIIPISKSEHGDNIEAEEITLSDLLSMMSSSSVSGSSTEESTEHSDEETSDLGKNAKNDIEAILSESEPSSTEQSEQLVSSTTEKMEPSSVKAEEISPSAEPSIAQNDEKETTDFPMESTSVKVDSTATSVEQTVSAVVGSSSNDTKVEKTTSADNVSSTAMPISKSSDSATENNTPSKSEANESDDMIKNDNSTTIEKIEVKSLAKENSVADESSTEPSTEPSAEPEPSSEPEPEPSSTESKPQSKLSDDELKVIPLQTPKKMDEEKSANESETKKSTEEAEEETTETTTGHFLSNATFQLNNKTVETSLNSSDIGNDTTNIEKDNEQTPISNDNSMNDTSVVSEPTFSYSRCTAGQFECLNGTSIIDSGPCISLSKRCDSVSQCSDSSDEDECEMLGCPGHFQCNDGSCLARSLVCDKILHCSDGSDEVETLCNDWKCKFDEMACSENGPCLPAILQCDGISHCSNQADETNCPDVCKNNEFFCSWQRKCIPEPFVCDGKIDCFGGEDERLCDCPEDHFKCNTGRCVPNHYRCDGRPQCADLSDDWDCFNITSVHTIVNKTTSSFMDDIDPTTTEINSNALQIKTPDGKFAFVCYENWNLNHADIICKNFGFARSMDYSSILIDSDNATFLKLSDDFQQGDSMLSSMNETDSCEDNEIVTLECEKYTCGNNLTRDREAAGKNQSWPSLAVAVNEISSVQCTATIVSPRWALASYSCILGKFELSSEVEKTLIWYLQVNGSNNDADESQQVNVMRIFKYPQAKFKHFLYSGDVVLLELENPLEFGETVTAACLSDEPINKDAEFCISVGWFSEEGDSIRKNYVKQLSTSPLSTESCNSTSNYAGSLPDDLICMENVNDDEKCQINTDEGAPLLCYSSSQSSWQMKGILSYRNGCRRHTLPAVYSELTPSLLKWITKTVGNDKMIQRRIG